MSLTSPASGFNVVADLCRSVTPGSLFFLFEVKKIPHMHFYVSINLLLVSWEACLQTGVGGGEGRLHVGGCLASV